MALIPLLSAKSPITAAQANAILAPLDDALSALFGGLSPLVFLPVGNSSSWFESRLSGLLFNFGTGTKRLLTGPFVPPVHSQGTYDAQAAAALPYPGANRFDTARHQVTVDRYLDGGDTVYFSDATHFDRSLRVHKKTFTEGEVTYEDYYLRLLAASSGPTEYFFHEHRHELAVADLCFEGHAARTFTFPATWDKFDCVRFHNLDPDETPLTITLEGTPDLVIELPRWKCVSVRRTGTTWEEQGYLMFRARAEDLARFGSTMPWNFRTNAAPWNKLREADQANGVASFGSIVYWIDYFSTSAHAAELMPYCGVGVRAAFHPRTGFWFDLSKVTNAGQIAALANATEPTTPLWRLKWHAGKFLVVRKLPDPAEPDPPALPEIQPFTASIEELFTGSHVSGIKLEIEASDLRISYWPADGTTFEFIDFIPLDCNFCGPVTLPVTGDPVTVQTYYLPAQPAMRRIYSPDLVVELAYGIGSSVQRNHPYLDLESTSDGSQRRGFPVTVGDIQAWEFLDHTTDNDYCAFGVNGTAWDGRRFVLRTSAEFAPTGGAYFPGFQLFTGSNLYPGDPNFLSPGLNFLAQANAWEWSQIDQVQVFPSKGGVWFTPDHPRRAWAPVTDDLWHPHALNTQGHDTGADWSALPTTQAPKSNIARLEDLPDALSYSYSCAGYPALDSLTYLSTASLTPEVYTANRSTIFNNTVLPAETRPILAAGLQSLHYNALASRLNALVEVFPFSFLDVQWYGQPFRPPVGRAGIYGGHIYPADHLANAPVGSQARQRATDLGIPIKVLSTELPIFADLLSVPIQATDSETVYDAFPSLNLLNDLLQWFRPDMSLAFPEITTILPGDGPPSDPGGGWFWGAQALPVSYSYWWRGTTNAQAIVPVLDFVTVTDVYDAAVALGLPFRLERFGLPLKIKVFLPERNGSGTRNMPPPPSWLGTRTQAALVIDSSETPQMVAYGGRTGDGNDPYWFAPDGYTRLADWPRYPEEMASDDVEVMQMLSSTSRGYDRGVTSPVYMVTIATGGGSPFTGEAPRLVLQQRVTAGQGESRLMCLPVGAVQWGAEDLVSVGPPTPGPGGLFPVLSTLPAIITAADLADGEAWHGLGGFQVGIVPVGVRFNEA